MGGFELRPVSGHIGAEVGGVDLRGLDDAGFEEIHTALLQHHVLFFRETDLSDAEHMELAARFGPVSIFPLMKVLGSTEPTFQVIEDGPDSPPAADYWHTDVTWTAEPPKVALLRATVVPERGGDTLWGSMKAAYEALSEPIRALLDGLTIHHDNTFFIEEVVRKMGSEQAGQLGFADRLREAYPGVDHPLIRTHPETGDRAIFYGGSFMRRVVGLAPHESDAILRLLARHIDDPRFHCRWRWRAGDLAIWDERCTVHRAAADHGTQRREVRRCVVDGDRPF